MRRHRFSFYRQEGDVVGMHARRVEPEGTIVSFSGKAFTKEIVGARGVKYLAMPHEASGIVIALEA